VSEAWAPFEDLNVSAIIEILEEFTQSKAEAKAAGYQVHAHYSGTPRVDTLCRELQVPTSGSRLAEAGVCTFGTSDGDTDESRNKVAAYCDNIERLYDYLARVYQWPHVDKLRVAFTLHTMGELSWNPTNESL
jgi:hypothetical protein